MSFSFSQAQYDSLIKKIENGINDTVNAANSLIHRIENWTSWIPFVSGWIKDALNKFVQLLDDLLKKIASYLKYAAFPPVFWEYGQHWLGIANNAAQSASQLATLKQYSTEWAGLAGGKYNAAVTGQEPAVDTIQARANSVSSACTGTAVSGFAFYVSLAGLTVSLCVGIATAPTGVVPIAAIVGAGISLVTAISSVTFGLGSQERSFEQATEPTDTLPGGMWPKATAS
jgi:hypothetical protein